MKHLKYFESEYTSLFPKREYCYYIPYGDLLLVKFALEKLNVVNTDKIIDEIEHNFKKIMGVYIFMSSKNDASFWAIRHKRDLEDAEVYMKDKGVEYRGIFELEPHELASFDYNL